MTAELRVVAGEQQDKLVGATIDGRYEVERVLGEGGMGLVYKARHIVLNKPLAIKVLRPDVSRDEEIITRFRQEAQSASAIGNQHIIDISDFGTLPDNSTYFVMEFLDGTDLTGAIESKGRMEPARVVHVAKQLCQALGAAHESGIVHRDLKPDNIYLIKRGGDSSFVKVLDFGIAKVGGSSSKLTRAGQVFGTPHYMSPEQCAGSGVDHRTDIYAIGIILYEMLTGAVPFDADNLMGILTKHLYEEPKQPKEVVPDLPDDLNYVVLKAMAKQADVRYQTMNELYEDLLRVEQGVGTIARETTQSVQIADTDEPSTTSVGKSKMPLIAGAIVLLLGAGAAAAFMASGDPEPVPTPPVVTPPVVTPEPEPEPEPVAMEAIPAEVPRVSFTSEPVGAEVYRGNALLGNTPFEIAKPEAGQTVELELRLVGFRNKQFLITSDSRNGIVVRLEPERAGSSSRMGGSSARPQQAEMAAEPAMTEPAMVEAPMMATMQSQTEVLDPWAD